MQRKTFDRMRRLCSVVTERTELWSLYAADFESFIDDTERELELLRLERDKLRGVKRSYTSVRSAQYVQRQRVWDTRPHVCARCGLPLTWKIYRLHHIDPVCDGGSFDDDNLEMLCANCHALM